MSETKQVTKTEKSETKAHEPKNRDKQRAKKVSSTPEAELSGLKEWLASLEIGGKNPVHVNGTLHPTAIVTVDFGQPIKSVKLTSEQSNELNQRLKRLTKEVVGKDVSIRVSTDSGNGIYWTTVA